MTATLFTGANHVCIVTRDLDRAVRAWVERYGVGPWQPLDEGRRRTCPPSSTAGPTSFAFRVGLCTLVIGVPPGADPAAGRARPVRGLARPPRGARPRASPQAGRRRLRRCPRVARRARIGVPLDASVRRRARCRVGGVRATYFDTMDELGFTLEIADVPAGFAMPEPELVVSVPDTRQEADREPDSRDPTPPRGRRHSTRTRSAATASGPPLARAAQQTRPLIPTGHGGGMWYQLPIPCCSARQGLPGLGRRRQRVPRPPDRRLGDDPRPRERQGQRGGRAQLEKGTQFGCGGLGL